MKTSYKRQAGFSAVAILIIVIVLAAVFAAFFMLESKRHEPIKIGAILTLSGPGGYYGGEVRDAMIVAVEEINALGGINGRKIEMIIEDSKTNPEEAKAAFNHIETEHHPDLYISNTSYISSALAPLAEASRIVLVGLLASALEVTEGREWVFKYHPVPQTEAKPVLFILEALQIETLGIMYSNEPYGVSVSQSVEKAFEKTGGTVKMLAFKMKQVDFQQHIAKLKDVEAMYIVGYQHHYINTFKQLQEANFRGDIIAASPASVPAVVDMPEANGVYLAATIVHDPNFLFAKELKDKYEGTYDKPFNHYAANGYDFIKLLAGLLEDEELSREAIKDLLEEGFIYSGVFGTLHVKPGEHNFSFPLHPARIVDARIKYLR